MSLNEIANPNLVPNNALNVTFNQITCNNITGNFVRQLTIPGVQIVSSPSGNVVGTVNIQLYRIGNVVTVQIPAFSATADPARVYYIIYATIPTAYQPNTGQETYIPIAHTVNANLPAWSTDALLHFNQVSSQLQIENGGDGNTNNTFAGNTNNYFTNISVSYLTDSL